MIKWKWMGWLGKAVVTAVIIAGLSVFTTWYTVNQYIQQILRQFHMENVTAEFKISDFMSHLSGFGNILQLNNHSKIADSQNQRETAAPPDSSAPPLLAPGSSEPTPPTQASPGPTPPEQAPLAQGLSASASGPGSSGPASQAQASPTPGSTAADPLSGTRQQPSGADPERRDADSGMNGGGSGTPGEAVPVFGQRIGQEGQDQKTLISADELYRKKEEISNEDKMNLFSMLVAKLPQQELQKISSAFEDGITAAELEQMKQIISTYLSDEEMERLIAILNKY